MVFTLDGVSDDDMVLCQIYYKRIYIRHSYTPWCEDYTWLAFFSRHKADTKRKTVLFARIYRGNLTPQTTRQGNYVFFVSVLSARLGNRCFYCTTDIPCMEAMRLNETEDVHIRVCEVYARHTLKETSFGIS